MNGYMYVFKIKARKGVEKKTKKGGISGRLIAVDRNTESVIQ